MRRRLKVIVGAAAMSLVLAVGLASATTASDPGVSKSSIERWMSDALKDLAEDEP